MHRAVFIAQHGAAHVHRFDCPFYSRNSNVVADVVLILEEDKKTVDHIFHQRLCAKANCQAGNAGARQQRSEIDSQQREDLEAGHENDYKNAHAAGHCGQRPDLLGAETWWDFADMQRDNLGREGPEYADQHQRYDHDYQDLRDVVTEENHGVFPPISQQCGKIPAFGHS